MFFPFLEKKVAFCFRAQIIDFTADNDWVAGFLERKWPICCILSMTFHLKELSRRRCDSKWLGRRVERLHLWQQNEPVDFGAESRSAAILCLRSCVCHSTCSPFRWGVGRGGESHQVIALNSNEIRTQNAIQTASYAVRNTKTAGRLEARMDSPNGLGCKRRRSNTMDRQIYGQLMCARK